MDHKQKFIQNCSSEFPPSPKSSVIRRHTLYIKSIYDIDVKNNKKKHPFIFPCLLYIDIRESVLEPVLRDKEKREVTFDEFETS